ncbi:MAG: ferredoxin [Rhodobacterales bacterium]
MSLHQIRMMAQNNGLDVYGAYDVQTDDFSQAASLVLLGPAADFWSVFTASDIYQDGQSDPIDRWSTKVITAIANDLGARPVFPFGDPPHAPFLQWARASGQAWNSPVGMLVHDSTGLMVSYRGALAFDTKLALPDQTFQNPCKTCADRPCLTACPVDALGSDGYDVAKCHAYLDTDAGTQCLTAGCLVRSICPASKGAHRLAKQSALHMRAFRGK